MEKRYFNLELRREQHSQNGEEVCETFESFEEAKSAFEAKLEDCVDPENIDWDNLVYDSWDYILYVKSYRHKVNLERTSANFVEYAYAHENIRELLDSNDLEILESYEELEDFFKFENFTQDGEI